MLVFCFTVHSVPQNRPICCRKKGRLTNQRRIEFGRMRCGSTASQRRRIEAAVMKLLRPLAGYSLHDQKTNDFIGREIKITGILDKIDEYRLNWQ